MAWGVMTNYGNRSESFFVSTNRNRYIVDAGCGALGRKCILSNQRRLRDLDYFVISHGDKDHVDLAEEIVDTLSPKVIVMSPGYYAITKFDEATNDYMIHNSFKRYFSDRKIWQNSDYYQEKVPVEMKLEYGLPPVFFVRRDISDWHFAWEKQPDSIALPEFQTYPTKKSIEWGNMVHSFAQKLIGQPPDISGLANCTLIKNLEMGFLLQATQYSLGGKDYIKLFKYIKDELIVQIENDMSLICRIGNMIFTGDATAGQLEEVQDVLLQQQPSLTPLTIKINHHASGKRLYRNASFYQKLLPETLVLKRDDRVTKALNRTSPSYDTLLQGIVQKVNGHWIDSLGLRPGQHKCFRF